MSIDVTGWLVSGIIALHVITCVSVIRYTLQDRKDD